MHKCLLKTYRYTYTFNNFETTIRTSFCFISLINVLLVIRHNDMEANLAVLGYVSFFIFIPHPDLFRGVSLELSVNVQGRPGAQLPCDLDFINVSPFIVASLTRS